LVFLFVGCDSSKEYYSVNLSHGEPGAGFAGNYPRIPGRGIWGRRMNQ
jgi:hypothetical protein